MRKTIEAQLVGAETEKTCCNCKTAYNLWTRDDQQSLVDIEYIETVIGKKLPNTFHGKLILFRFL